MKKLPKLLQDTATAVPEVAAEQLAESNALDVQVPHQEQDNWCWCAVTVGFNTFFDSAFSLAQCETAAEVLGIKDACIRPGDDDVNTLFELDVALSKFGRLAHMSGVLKFEEIQKQIDAGRPVGVHVFFVDSGVSHFTVIRGYRSGPVSTLAIDDPLYDESEWSYQEFVDSYKGSGAWKHSYLTQ